MDVICLLKITVDLVMCIDVIEHVGEPKAYSAKSEIASKSEAKTLIQELRRVTNDFLLIATPNRYFPIEVHTLIPFLGYLSTNQRRFCYRHFKRLFKGYKNIEPFSINEIKKLLEPEFKNVHQEITLMFASSLFHKRKILGTIFKGIQKMSSLFPTLLGSEIFVLYKKLKK